MTEQQWSDEERRLAVLLKQSVPTPPRSVDATDVASRLEATRTIPRRATGGWIPAMAAACVLAVVAGLGVLLVHHRGSSDAPGQAPTAGIPSDSSPPSHTARPGIQLTVGPWSAVALTHGSAVPELVSSANSLYALTQTTISRVSTTDGGSLATAAVDPGAVGAVVLTPNALWQSVEANGAIELESRDPTTLQPANRLRIDGATVPTNNQPWTPQLAASADASRLYLGDGSNVFIVNPQTGAVQAKVEVTGAVTAMAVSADGTSVYVAAGSSTLLRLDANTLDVQAQTSITDGEPITGMLATAGGVWLTFSGGHADSVRFAPLSDLNRGHVVSSGGGGSPSSVTLAGGVVWLGGPNTVSCSDPVTGTVRASAPAAAQVGEPGSLVDVRHVGQTWVAAYQAGQSAGIARFNPPAQCTP